jgi:hypothetical protein
MLTSSHHGDSPSASTTPLSVASAGNVFHPAPLPPAPTPVAVPAAPPAQAQANGGPRVRLMTSFGGRILPRPGDRQLRYVQGETRIVTFPRATTSYATLVAALATVAPGLYAPGAPRPTIKYKLPMDDLDSLISVSSDDDVDHLMDELDRHEYLNANVAKPARLRAFLFTSQSPGGAFGSILSGTGGEAACDQWFIDALNAPAPRPVERGRSESSSLNYEVPDYFVALEDAFDERSPVPTATNNKPDTETPDGDDDVPPPAPFEHVSSYASPVGSPWPALPPLYMGQLMYYYPPPPVHYPSAQGGGYMPRPVYHMVGGGGSEAPGHPHAAAGGMGHVYGIPSPMQPFPPPMLYAPARTVVYPVGEKPPSEGVSHSSTPESSP